MVRVGLFRGGDEATAELPVLSWRERGRAPMEGMESRGVPGEAAAETWLRQ